MSFIPDGCSQINLKFTGTAVPLGAQCTFGVDHGEATTAATIGGLVLEALEASALIEQCSKFVGVSSILIKMGPNQTGQMAEIPAAEVGVGLDPAVAPNTSVLIRKSTSLGGRMNSGRMFIPGISETVVSEAGMLSGGAHTAWQVAAENFLEALQTKGVPMVLLHSSSQIQGLPLAVTSLQVDNRVATQRRRLRR